MKNKWGRRIGVFAMAAISSALMFSSNGIVAKAEDTEWNYGYTGNIQTFTVPHDGNYRLEVWGAQGGNSEQGAIGGYGGYSTGKIFSKTNDILYIYVGGAGSDTINSSVNARNGGYNGGGLSVGDEDHHAGSSGGATHIALNVNRGVLSNYKNNVNEILIVAGGGGGSRVYAFGGSGGGYSGGTGGRGEAASLVWGGTQTGAGANGGFGYGGSMYTGTLAGGAGGGGGYYGGSGGFDMSGGGGSGYLNTTKITEGTMTNGVRSGNGYARVTAVHTHTYTSAITTAPTCENDGVRTYTCTGNSHDAACGHQYTEIIPKLNHDCSVVIELGEPGYEVPGRPGYFYTRK